MDGGFLLMHIGVEVGKRVHGVAMIIGKKLSACIQEVIMINKRLMNCVLKIKNKKYIYRLPSKVIHRKNKMKLRKF